MFVLCPGIENKMKIGSLGGIKVIMAAMKGGQGHETIQDVGFRALVSLAANPGIRN